jgi:hypothetical protein
LYNYGSTSMSASLVARRAIEALRNGVPNPFAVAELGSWQQEVEEKFWELCNAPSLEPGGMLVKGDFGTGKSHLLLTLQEKAKKQGFATSLVVISKELPLGNPSRLIPRILAEIELPDMAERGLQGIAARLQYKQPSFQEFQLSVNQWRFGEGWWPATLALHQRLEGDDEKLDAIVRFWAGEPTLRLSEVRQRLRDHGLPGAYSVSKLPPAESLHWQRLAFSAQLCRAIGLRGLVVLVDEIELIAQYSILQRVKSYRVLGHLFGKETLPEELKAAPLILAGAVTRDFEQSILQEKGDREKAPEMARQKHISEEAVKAGMEAIQQAIPLRSCSEAQEAIQAMLHKVADLYQKAYPDWVRPSLSELPPLYGTTTVRSIIRRWITEWDVRRYYNPTGTVQIEEDKATGHTPTEEIQELEEEA